MRSFAQRRGVRTTWSDASIAIHAVSPTDLNRHLREIITDYPVSFFQRHLGAATQNHVHSRAIRRQRQRQELVDHHTASLLLVLPRYQPRLPCRNKLIQCCEHLIRDLVNVTPGKIPAVPVDKCSPH